MIRCWPLLFSLPCYQDINPTGAWLFPFWYKGFLSYLSWKTYSDGVIFLFVGFSCICVCCVPGEDLSTSLIHSRETFWPLLALPVVAYSHNTSLDADWMLGLRLQFYLTCPDGTSWKAFLISWPCREHNVTCFSQADKSVLILCLFDWSQMCASKVESFSPAARCLVFFFVSG